METLEELLSGNTIAVPKSFPTVSLLRQRGTRTRESFSLLDYNKQRGGGCHSPRGGTQDKKCCYLIKGMHVSSVSQWGHGQAHSPASLRTSLLCFPHSFTTERLSVLRFQKLVCLDAEEGVPLWHGTRQLWTIHPWHPAQGKDSELINSLQQTRTSREQGPPRTPQIPLP